MRTYDISTSAERLQESLIAYHEEVGELLSVPGSFVGGVLCGAIDLAHPALDPDYKPQPATEVDCVLMGDGMSNDDVDVEAILAAK